MISDYVHPHSTVSASDIIKGLFDSNPELLTILRTEGSKPLSEVLKSKYRLTANPDYLLTVWEEYYIEQTP